MKWQQTAARQAGVVTASQLVASGLSPAMLKTLLVNRALRRRYRGVYVVAGSPRTPEQERVAAVLATTRGALSHRASAAEWGASRFRDARPELVVPGNDSVRRPGVIIHRSATLARSDVFAHGPIPRIIRPSTTVLHLADLATVDDDALEEAGADLLLGFPGERPRLRETLARLATSRRRGPGRVDRLFGEYLAEGRRPPHPGVHRRLLGIITASRELPPPIVHFRLATPDGLLEVDLAWPDVRLAIEADSARWHTSPPHLRTDRARDQAAAMVGWQTIRFPWEQVRDDPAGVERTLIVIRHQRRAVAG